MNRTECEFQIRENYEFVSQVKILNFRENNRQLESLELIRISINKLGTFREWIT